jgi:hypothetical protein
MILSTLPKAERATDTDRALSAFAPKTFLKKEAARILPEEKIASFGTAAKYAIWV